MGGVCPIEETRPYWAYGDDFGRKELIIQSLLNQNCSWNCGLLASSWLINFLCWASDEFLGTFIWFLHVRQQVGFEIETGAVFVILRKFTIVSNLCLSMVYHRLQVEWSDWHKKCICAFNRKSVKNKQNWTLSLKLRTWTLSPHKCIKYVKRVNRLTRLFLFAGNDIRQIASIKRHFNTLSLMCLFFKHPRIDKKLYPFEILLTMLGAMLMPLIQSILWHDQSGTQMLLILCPIQARMRDSQGRAEQGIEGL